MRDTEKRQIAATIEKLSGRYSRWEIWQDFVTMSAISIANVADGPYREAREKMYLERAAKYNQKELESFADMLTNVVTAMEDNPDQDFLGELYMELNLGNTAAGQFFTPYHVCHLMAEMNCGGNLAAQVEGPGWITANDPCCGGGALLLAFANVCRNRGINFQTSVLFVAQDIDFTVAMMCYIQLSLMGCAGYVKVGNSLTEPLISVDRKELTQAPEENIWFTPMYFSDLWAFRRALAKIGTADLCGAQRKEEKEAHQDLS